ncbi:urease accessory protein UreE [Pseudorhodoplanes sp.]|uniref:urease accessory protein UreE n=1 Tax=Pseudorhodoplanes sp. TaxID=1934341 RepID=UPI002BEDA528|nr:urease accessory protein UreE [Pseudorhodoplanes sp.]HWV53878.1 urease accessory protein UreE [Pseudorhodoplanes sp.]
MTLRAVSVVATHDPDARTRDTVLLNQDARRAPRGMVVGLRGTPIEFALPAGTRLGVDDRVLLDDGSAVDIVASPEPLIEVRAKDAATLARAAWLLGDHHIPVEIHARYLRVSRTGYVSDLLRTLDVNTRQIDAPFEPEGGAYDHMAGGDT